MHENVLSFPARSPRSSPTAIEISNQGTVQRFASPVYKRRAVTMHDHFQREASDLADRFLQGRMGEIIDLFLFPAVVYVGEKVIILDTPDQMLTALSRYRSVLSDEWLSLITSSIVDTDCESGEVCKVAVENRYFATDGSELGAAKINYFGEGSAADRKISMVEYLEWPCPQRIAECRPLQRMMA